MCIDVEIVTSMSESHAHGLVSAKLTTRQRLAARQPGRLHKPTVRSQPDQKDDKLPVPPPSFRDEH